MSLLSGAVAADGGVGWGVMNKGASRWGFV